MFKDKNESKTKQSLSRPARRELTLAQSKWRTFLKVAPLWQWFRETRGLTWTPRPINREWCHFDPGRASGLTVNRDWVNVLGAGQPESQFFTPFWALVSFFCSAVPHGNKALVVWAFDFNYRPSLCLRHVHGEGPGPTQLTGQCMWEESILKPETRSPNTKFESLVQWVINKHIIEFLKEN